MTHTIITQRLKLVELSVDELKCYLDDVGGLEQQLGVRLSCAVLTDRVHRAIGMKLEKMKTADPALHAWYTYWLMVIPDVSIWSGSDRI